MSTITGDGQQARMSGLYERDALAWAEQQAALLDRMAAGERLNEAVDWPNVIGEVRDVGLEQDAFSLNRLFKLKA